MCKCSFPNMIVLTTLVTKEPGWCKYSFLNMIVGTTLGQFGQQGPPCGLTMADGDANCVTICWEMLFI